MNLKEHMIRDTYAILAELQSGTLDDNPNLKLIQQTKLSLLYDYVGEDMPEAYWKQIEDAIYN